MGGQAGKRWTCQSRLRVHVMRSGIQVLNTGRNNPLRANREVWPEWLEPKSGHPRYRWRGKQEMTKKTIITVPMMSLCVLVGLACGQSTSLPKAPNEASQVQAPRPVSGTVLTSTTMPAVRLEFGKDFKYVGTQSFVLYDVANAEQHFFVDADKEGRVKRLYWVQFEGYLPTNTHTYRYKGNKVVNIGGLDFIADAQAVNFKATPSPANSDGSRGRAFLENKGYRIAGDDILMQRLVHLVDEAKRNELMIIYAEDLSGLGLTAAALAPNGGAAARWGEISAGILERAQKGMKVVRLGSGQ